MLFKIGLEGFLHKVYTSRAGIWVPWCDALVDRRDNVLAVLGQPYRDGQVKTLIPGYNLITDDGDLHYAQRADQEAVTNSFTHHVMCGSGPVAAKGDQSVAYGRVTASHKIHQVVERNNADGDNSGGGADIITWAVSYDTADFTEDSIQDGIIVNSGGDDTDHLILTGYPFAAAFAKTSDDTLKVFVNHTFNGV